VLYIFWLGKINNVFFLSNLVRNIITHFIFSYIARRLVKNTKCDMCIESLKNLNTSGAGIGKEADLINAKTRGYLTYPNSNLYIIVKRIEECFAVHANSSDVFENTYEEFFKQNMTLKFSCTIQEHQIKMLTDIFSYYIMMRMRQFTYIQNQKNKKENKTKKKLSKLVKS